MLRNTLLETIEKYLEAQSSKEVVLLLNDSGIEGDSDQNISGRGLILQNKLKN